MSAESSSCGYGDFCYGKQFAGSLYGFSGTADLRAFEADVTLTRVGLWAREAEPDSVETASSDYMSYFVFASEWCCDAKMGIT